MNKPLAVDPRIEIKIVADGEIHILFTWTLEDLAQIARAFVLVSEGKMKPGEVLMAFRLRTREGIDYLIDQLTQARVKLYGPRAGGNQAGRAKRKKR